MKETGVLADIAIRCGECDTINTVHFEAPEDWFNSYVTCDGCEKPFDVELRVEEE